MDLERKSSAVDDRDRHVARTLEETDALLARAAKAIERSKRLRERDFIEPRRSPKRRRRARAK
jgi:hypothetical protein